MMQRNESELRKSLPQFNANKLVGELIDVFDNGLPVGITDISATCQPQCWLKKPPNGGLVQAIKPKPVMALDITRAPLAGSYKSRTTALALVITAPMLAPCTMRQNTSVSMLVLNTQPMAAMA